MQDRSSRDGATLIPFPRDRVVVALHLEAVPLERDDLPENVILFPARHRRGDASGVQHSWEKSPVA